MSKKKPVPPPALPPSKSGSPKRNHNEVSASFRHCRPKRDWSAPAK